MNLDDAYSMMDLLLDEADLPYFSNEEKHKFLGLSISDFINMHYERMTSDEVYPETYGTHTYGFFRHASQYVLPKNHLYVLQMAVKYYNKEDIIDPTTSLVYPGITLDDIVFTDRISVQNKSTRDYYEDSYSKDPFNNADMENPHWSYIENRIVIGGGASSIFEVSFQTITLPTVEEAFKESIKNETTNVYTYGARSFQLHHKTQIIQAAVGKMSQHIDLHN